jgi:hypothetical protein
LADTSPTNTVSAEVPWGDDRDEKRRFPGARLHSLTVAESPQATARISAVFGLRRRLRFLRVGWHAFTQILADQLYKIMTTFKKKICKLRTFYR